MSKQTKGVVLGCFSPPVMVATFLVEIISAIFVVCRYKLTTKGRLIVALLINLALFQAAEYFVCQNSTIAMASSRIGYAAITLLPVLGLHLMTELVNYKNRILMPILYALAAIIAVYFLTKSNAFNGYECTGNYVIFQIGRVQSLIYSTYYFGLIAVSVWIGARHHRTNVRKRFDAVWWLTIGYLVFILPVAILTVAHPDTRKAVPSILCGFAVTLAIILVSLVAPLSLKKR